MGGGIWREGGRGLEGGSGVKMGRVRQKWKVRGRQTGALGN